MCKCVICKKEVEVYPEFGKKDYVLLNSDGDFACSKECEKFSFRLSNAAFPKPLLLSENSLFFENETIPSKKELASIGVDRIVTIKH